jgi:hypothetical protein
MRKKKTEHTVMREDTAKELMSEQLATVADLYVTPPQLKTEVHEWSGFNLNKDGKAIGKMKHWIQKVAVESFGEWGDYDGEKIAKAMEKAAERELNRQAKQYINRKIQEETNGT